MAGPFPREIWGIIFTYVPHRVEREFNMELVQSVIDGTIWELNWRPKTNTYALILTCKVFKELICQSEWFVRLRIMHFPIRYDIRTPVEQTTIAIAVPNGRSKRRVVGFLVRFCQKFNYGPYYIYTPFSTNFIFQEEKEERCAYIWRTYLRVAPMMYYEPRGWSFNFPSNTPSRQRQQFANFSAHENPPPRIINRGGHKRLNQPNKFR